MILEEIQVLESQLQEGHVFLSEAMQEASEEEFDLAGVRVDSAIAGWEKFWKG